MPSRKKPSIDVQLNTHMGQRVWHEIMEKCAAEIRSAFRSGPSAAELERALQTLLFGRHKEGYLQGLVDGYGVERCLRKDKSEGTDIGRVIRRHPDWSTKQICKRLESLGKKIPEAQLRAGESRSWEDAVKDRGSRLCRVVEKEVSRVRIAVQLMSQARTWKRHYINKDGLP